MKNYLVITIGTRDVQIRKETLELNNFEIEIEIRREVPFRFVRHTQQPDTRIAAKPTDDFPDFYTINPRADGEIILKERNWYLFRPIIDIPLIRPAIEHLKNKSVSIDIIMLVFTDQLRAFEEGRIKKKSYTAGDTVFFAEIIERFLREDSYFDQTRIDPFGRYNSVADMAVQYDEFRKIKDDLISDDEVGNVYLFAQGGIDQINHALTLRLIETFEGRVIYLQNADGQEVQELDFPRRFVDTLASKKIGKHLDDYDFDAITEELHSNKSVFEKANYAALRLNLQYNDLHQEISEQEKMADLYLAMKIRFLKQRKYNEFLWRAHTLNEVLFKIPVENIIGPLGQYFSSALGKNDVNEPFERKLNETHPDLIAYLKKKKVAYNNPNRWAYKSIYIFLCNNGIINDTRMGLRKRVGDRLELLAKKRNSAQHGLGSITLNEIEEILGGQKREYKSDQLFADLDQIFNITNFGIYDTIRDEILNFL